MRVIRYKQQMKHAIKHANKIKAHKKPNKTVKQTGYPLDRSVKR